MAMSNARVRLFSLGIILGGALALGGPASAFAHEPPPPGGCGSLSGGPAFACVYSCANYTQQGKDFQCLYQNNVNNGDCCANAYGICGTCGAGYESIVCYMHDYGPDYYCPLIK